MTQSQKNKFCCCISISLGISVIGYTSAVCVILYTGLTVYVFIWQGLFYALFTGLIALSHALMILFFFQMKQLEWNHSTDSVNSYKTAKDFYYAHLICVVLQCTMYQALYIGYACYFRFTCSKLNRYHWMEILWGSLLIFKLFFNAIAYKQYTAAFKRLIANPPQDVCFSVNSAESSSYKRITALTASKETPRSIKTETE